MGTNFSNFQVFCADSDPSVVRDRMISAIREHLLGSGYQEVSSSTGEEQVDRTVVLGPATTGSWIALYDDESEFEIDNDGSWGSHLSIALGCPVLGVTVADSDALHLSLFENGSVKDVLDSSKRRRKKLEKWSTLLGSPTRLDEFGEAFFRKNVFADDNLRDVAPILNLDLAYYSVGLGHLNGVHLQGLTTLRFKNSIPAPAEKRQTAFDFLSWLSFWNGRVGESKEVSTGVTNLGESSIGLQVIVWGAAVDDKVVDVGSVHVWGNNNNQALLPTLVTAENNHRVWVATFSDFAIPEGFDKQSRGNARIGWKKALDRQYEAGFHCSVHLTACTPGTSQLLIGFVPIANRGGYKAYPVSLSLAD